MKEFKAEVLAYLQVCTGCMGTVESVAAAMLRVQGFQ
jgi:hypothetical protein